MSLLIVISNELQMICVENNLINLYSIMQHYKNKSNILFNSFK